MNLGASFDSDSSRELREIKRRINNINGSIICLSVLLFFVLYKDYELHTQLLDIINSFGKDLEYIKKLY